MAVDGRANEYPGLTQLQASRLGSGWAEAFQTLARPFSQLGPNFLLLFSFFFLVNPYSTKGIQPRVKYIRTGPDFGHFITLSKPDPFINQTQF